MIKFKTYLLIIILFIMNGANTFCQQTDIDCKLKFSGLDSKINKIRTQTQFYKFIEYFPLKNTSDLNYTIPNIYVSLTQIKKKTFLNLKILFKHYNILNYPGFIPDKAQIIFHFISGEHLVLLNVNDVMGERIGSNQLLYQPTYYIPTEDLSVYKNKDIDYVSINWTKESQTYETFQVDVIRNLFTCLEYKKYK